MAGSVADSLSSQFPNSALSSNNEAGVDVSKKTTTAENKVVKSIDCPDPDCGSKFGDQSSVKAHLSATHFHVQLAMELPPRHKGVYSFRAQGRGGP